MNAAEQFFYDHAGWAEPPGREACAKALAQAEAELRASGAYVSWERDDIDSSFYETTDEPRRLYVATLWCREPVASLGGIDAERGDPYRRVVEAELWEDFAAQRETAIVRGEN